MASTTRERIVGSAATLFLQRGLAGSGIKDISAASGAPVGSVYHHFPGGKGELAAAALRDAGAGYQALVEGVWDAEGGVADSVRACFDGAVAILRESDYADACPVATVALEVASSDDALRQVAAEVFAAWLSALEERLTGAGIAPGVAARLATTVIAALEGGFLLSRVARDASALEALGRSMVELVEAAVAGADG